MNRRPGRIVRHVWDTLLLVKAGMVLVVLLGVGACATDDRYLPALLEDPMAHLELPGTELIRRSETKQGEGLVQQRQARIQLTLRVVDPGAADSVLADAVTFAETVGWVFEERLPHETVLHAHKELDAGRARISLWVGDRTGETTL